MPVCIVGCSREDNGLHGRAEAGEQIKFTATIGSTSAATKAPASSSFRIFDTRFSGTLTPITASSYGEAIEWTSRDVITIAEAVTGNTSDYDVDSEGELSLSSGSTALRWGRGAHKFMAVYPSAAQLAGAAAPEVTLTDGTDACQMSIPLSADPMPTTQYCYKWDQDNGIRPYKGQDGATKNELYYGPNMRYARMTASSEVAAPQPQGVELVFYPQFSSVEVKLLKPDDMSGATVKLLGARLTAGSGAATAADLSGTPAISQPSAPGTTMEVKKLSSAGRATVAYASNGSKHNYIDLKFKDSESAAETSSPELNESTPLSFTFLLLPVDVTQLELALTLEVTNSGITKTETKTLQLKDANGWIDLPAGKKLTVTNLETWKVDVLGPSAYTEKTFRVSATQRVKFSPGNLQAVIRTAYSATNARWQFADRQFQYPSRANNDPYTANVDETVDLFMQPESATGNYAFGIPWNSSYSPTTTNFADWGKHLDIYPNSDETSTPYAKNTYRTLTAEEWDYLLNTRPSGGTVGNAIGTARYSKVILNVGGTTGSIRGMLIFPDGFTWTSDMGTPPIVNGEFYGYLNQYTLAQFGAMEAAGVVFLPAAGYCYGNNGNFSSVDDFGYYWSSDDWSSDGGYSVQITSSSMTVPRPLTRAAAISVRLVRDVVSEFTVSSDGKKVEFSPGHLQAVIATTRSATNARWQFADNQHKWSKMEGLYPRPGSDESYSAEIGDIVEYFSHPESSTGYNAYGIPVDYLNWGGVDEYYPTTTNFADWGQNPIYPNSTASTPYSPNTYRTLTIYEWDYLLNQRESGATVGGTANARYSIVTLLYDDNNLELQGMLIYPNGFTWDANTMGAAPNVNSSTVPTVPYTLAQFRAMEAEGVVYLPIMGRVGQTGYRPHVSFIEDGLYWSATIYPVTSGNPGRGGCPLHFKRGEVRLDEYEGRTTGFPVRLVRNKN